MNFNQAPFIVIWETTQACDLACREDCLPKSPAAATSLPAPV